ncbi:MAG: FAD:protein FMN transferase [Deltaproteobacteria bacterium]|nr:FAD:protein FMN transferase [Deltaproteobacteria bacterium]
MLRFARHRCLLLALFGAAPAAAQEPVAPPPPQPSVISDTKDGLGSHLMVAVYSADADGARRAIDAAMARMLAVEAELADYVPASELSKVNLGAGKGPVSVSPLALRMLLRGREVQRLSRGAWALSAAALQGLWDFGAAKPRPPDAVRLRERLARVDDAQIVLDVEHSQVTLQAATTSIGLGGMVRGAAADEALALLVGEGFANALVFAGGDIRAVGSKGPKPWIVGLQDPRAVGYYATLPLKDEAVATVGDYQRFVQIDGERLCDILDPRTGLPAKGARSVTVVAKDAATAHALATTLFVLGPTEGLALADTEPEVQAVIVDAGNNLAMSAGLKDRLRVVRPPSE